MKRVGKLACQRASADCSAIVLRKAKQSAYHHLERGGARESISKGVAKTQNDDHLFLTYKALTTVGALLFFVGGDVLGDPKNIKQTGRPGGRPLQARLYDT